jgi:hypothetical protein
MCSLVAFAIIRGIYVFDKMQRTLLGTHMLHLHTFWKHAFHFRKSLENMHKGKKVKFSPLQALEALRVVSI